MHQVSDGGHNCIEGTSGKHFYDYFILVNCVDRYAESDPDRVALIWEKDEPGQEERVTYR